MLDAIARAERATPRAGAPAIALERVTRGGVNPAALELARANPRAKAQVDAHGLNGLERAYADELELLTRGGRVAFWRSHPFSIRLAPRTHYRPDFLVVLADGRTEVVEVKGGHWEDDARAKTKIAAALYPCWLFVAVTRPDRDAGFVREEFPSS